MSNENENEPTTFIQQHRDDYEDDGKFKKKVTLRTILCNKTVKGWIFLTIFAASVPILVYYFVIDQGTYDDDDSYTCLVQENFRVPCGKFNITRNECESVQCCYDRSTQICYHYLPSRYSYDIDEETETYMASQSTTPFGTDSLQKLKMSINEIDENKVSVVLFQDEVNVEDHYLDTEKNYKVNLVKEKLMVEVYRTNNDLLLTTAKGPLIASDTYWEWSFYLTNHSLFGLNKTLISVPVNTTFTKVLYKNDIDHSSLPVLWAYGNKKFHGVIIKHDGPLEITILPSNLVILRSLTGDSLELELSVGPTPKFLHDQQTQNVTLPPLWALQTHMCRRGSNTNLTELLADYSLDSQVNSDCIHENLVMGIMKDNNMNKDNLRSIVKNIKEQGAQFLLSVPPHVLQNYEALYNKSVDLDILYKYNSSIYTGKYLNEIVAYPDYDNSQIQNYLNEFSNLLSTYIDLEDIDGFVLHDNWPVHENYSMNSTHFPYLSQELRDAMSNTLPWNTTSNGSTLHINNHNAYGTSQMLSFQNYFKNISIIMSASLTFEQTVPSMIQNVNASWTDLQLQTDNMLFMSIFGNHLVNLPVCGDTTFFRSSLQETLCLRWYLIAATMPMFKISSLEPWRDPSNLNSVFAQNTASSTIELRNRLLPYYYTILNRNEPVIRPMFYDYYENETTFSLNNQYMIGESILVAHPFSTGRNRLQVYLPSRIEIWYELWGGRMYNSTKNAWTDFDIVETDFIAFISQGNILPIKEENNLDLIIALNCTTKPCEGKGTLLDSNYITFQSNETALTISDIPKDNCNYTLGSIKLYYYEDDISTSKHIVKDEDLCTDEVNVTILFNELMTTDNWSDAIYTTRALL
ncbi:lysosomal alpha-glucosidase-like [Anoplophora glabripennis]|uniref:lysosomal alpha-glucosidase-like n=1 Tax=Anoplophora glabripennis TaxID=217634 RepID=UPI0008754F19|nr:lysosomal alpha-glucosidase-like [Anoplophora glabripennis]